MEAVHAPSSLKGTRGPLLLVAIGGFLAVFAPATGLLATAGLALGMRDLRKVDAASELERWRSISEVSAWCACALWPILLLAPALWPLETLTQLLALFAAATTLCMLARAAEAESLSRGFGILRWVVLVPLALLPVTFFPLPLNLPPLAGIGLWIALISGPGSCFYFALLTLRLRKAALPYGQFRIRKLST